MAKKKITRKIENSNRGLRSDRPVVEESESKMERVAREELRPAQESQSNSRTFEKASEKTTRKTRRGESNQQKTRSRNPTYRGHF